MLVSLSIHNYALINQLEIDFSEGLTIITGETGAGKSILLGALGLILGNRADLATLKDESKKCIVEAQFDVNKYKLQDFFESLDIDYDGQTIIRREILPSGKSRAFVNDTPVNLSILNELKSKLMDIHSQHQTLQLSDTDFQFYIIDTLAKNHQRIASYQRGLKQLKQYQKEFDELKANQQEAQQQYEYNLHLFNELNEAKLKSNEQEELENQLDKLTNIEDIKLNLSEALSTAISEEIGVQSLIYLIDNRLQKIASYSKEYHEISSRIHSVKIEFDDIISELENANESVDFNPSVTEEINDRLQLIYHLQKKHTASTIEELLQIETELSEKVAQVENADEFIKKKQLLIDDVASKLDILADTISNERIKVLPKLQQELEKLLADLGMPNACFSIKINPSSTYYANGKDELEFLFSANKGGTFGLLKKVASGGELSRIMLSVKKILSENSHLPTIIFDEIDTGVSGEVSNKIAAIMEQMSNHMQVITITHLPQIAATGSHHLKVYKEEVEGVTTTKIRALSSKERVFEVAEMLSGKDISEAAITHAKELLA